MLIKAIEERNSEKGNTTLTSQQFWDKVTEDLNNEGPSIKNVERWKRVFLFVFYKLAY